MCSRVQMYQRFEGNCWLHLRARSFVREAGTFLQSGVTAHKTGMWDLKFSRQWLWRIFCYKMWLNIIRQKFTDVAKDVVQSAGNLIQKYWGHIPGGSSCIFDVYKSIRKIFFFSCGRPWTLGIGKRANYISQLLYKMNSDPVWCIDCGAQCITDASWSSTPHNSVACVCYGHCMCVIQWHQRSELHILEFHMCRSLTTGL
jgi:hypothetical protein